MQGSDLLYIWDIIAIDLSTHLFHLSVRFYVRRLNSYCPNQQYLVVTSFQLSSISYCHVFYCHKSMGGHAGTAIQTFLGFVFRGEFPLIWGVFFCILGFYNRDRFIWANRIRKTPLNTLIRVTRVGSPGAVTHGVTPMDHLPNQTIENPYK